MCMFLFTLLTVTQFEIWVLHLVICAVETTCGQLFKSERLQTSCTHVQLINGCIYKVVKEVNMCVLFLLQLVKLQLKCQLS